MLKKQGPYAGRVDYLPRKNLDQETLRHLSQKLVAAGTVQEPENPAVVIDWYLVERDRNRRPLKHVYIVLMRDGGDAESPGCIFYRQEINRQNDEQHQSIHIPAPDDQPALVSAWRWWSDPEGELLTRLNDYLDRLLEDESAWEPY